MFWGALLFMNLISAGCFWWPLVQLVKNTLSLSKGQNLLQNTLHILSGITAFKPGLVHWRGFILLNPVSPSPSSQRGSNAEGKKTNPISCALWLSVRCLHFFIISSLGRMRKKGSCCSSQCLKGEIQEVNPVTVLAIFLHCSPDWSL